MDDGNGGDFVSMIGYDNFNLKLTYTTTTPVTKGQYYRFRYRASNSVGWGDFSAQAFILAGQVPDSPPAPEYTSSTSTSITMSLSQTLDDGGDPVTGYKLYRDAGDDFTSGWTELTNYDGSSSSYAADTTNDGLVAGRVYRFVYVASNSIGDSEVSNDLIAGVGALPTPPSSITRDEALSNSTSMLVQWSEVTSSNLEILGYKLYMDDGLNGDLQEVYDGSVNPQTLQYRVSDLTAGRTYAFAATAFDINGEGA